jgi:antibiotic biosynthesis monooxygenase (ABM) superfamily enzyme
MAVVEPLGAWSSIPERNIWVSRRETIVSSVASLTWPSCTAWMR